MNYYNDCRVAQPPDANADVDTIARITTPKEMRAVKALNAALSEMMQTQLAPGMTTHAMDVSFFRACCQRGLYPSTLGHDNWPRASCISVNDVVCHGLPSEHVTVQNGDLVTLDLCAYAPKSGFHADMAHTVVVGGDDKADGTTRALLRATQTALDEAVSKACRPGETTHSIARIVEAIASHHGFHVIKGYGGHGIGRHLHMPPFVPNCMSDAKSSDAHVMQVGDLFTIEPMLAIGTGATKARRSKTFGAYDIRTVNGANAAHMERVVLITPGGAEVLNAV